MEFFWFFKDDLSTYFLKTPTPPLPIILLFYSIGWQFIKLLPKHVFTVSR